MSQKTLNLCLERYNFVKFGETTKSSHTVLCINNAYSVNSDKYRLTPTAIASKHSEGYVFTLNYDFDRPLFTIVQKSYTLDGTSGNIVFEGIDPISKGGSKYLRKVTVSPVKLSDGSYLLEVTGDEYLRIGTTGAALGDEELESLNEKIVTIGGIEKSVETVGGKQVLKLDASGSTGAKEIVYFDVNPSDPPSGIYEAIGEALSNNKIPVIKIDGAVYFYTATGTDKYVFVGGYTKEAVGYTEIEVSDDDSVTSKSVDDKVFNMYILPQDDPASPGETPSDEDQWVCDADKHVVTKDELVAAHADCRYFILNNAVEPDSNSRKYFASVTDISNSYIRLRFYMMQYDAQGVAEFHQKTVRDDSEGRLYILSSYSATLAGTNQAVLVSEPQDFNSTQKAQGRDNIGAASASDVTALQSQVSSLSDVSAYSVKGEATVAQLNAGPSGIQAGWAYQLTDSGTLTEGSLAVVAGDTVAWDGTKWFPLVKSDYYATKTYAQNVAHSIAPEFDPTRTSANPYLSGTPVMYNGKLYRFKVDHYGSWSSSDVIGPISSAHSRIVNLVPVALDISAPSVSTTYVTGVLKTDGTVQEVSGFVTSDYILIDKNKTYQLNLISLASGFAQVCMYDSEKQFIGFMKETAGRYVALAFDSSVAYFRATLSATDTVKERDAGSGIFFDNFPTFSKNLLDKTSLTDNVYINSSGAETSFSGGSASGYIPVKAGATYSINKSFGGSTARTAFYTKDKKFISSEPASSATVTAPANSAYMRCSFVTVNIPSASICAGANKLPNIDIPFGSAYFESRNAALVSAPYISKSALSFNSGVSFVDGIFDQNSSSSYKTSDYIDITISGGAKSEFYLFLTDIFTSFYSVVRFYDKDYNELERVQGGTDNLSSSSVYKVIAPKNAVYLKFAQPKTAVNAGTAGIGTLVKGSSFEQMSSHVFAANGNILWIGTSIPEGAKYPSEASSACGYKCTNKSLGSSMLRFTGVHPQTVTENSGKCLTATVAELETMYRQDVTDGVITEDRLNQWKNYSYENSILPYIDGTNSTQVSAIVLDHGFNDRTNIHTLMEDTSAIDWTSTDRANFVGAFNYLYRKILEVNPFVKLIISGYFQNIYDSYYSKDICDMQELIATKYDLPLMPAWKYSGINFEYVPGSSDYISNFNTEYGTSYTKMDPDGDGNIPLFQFFCPDKVHPHSDKTGNCDRRLNAVYTKLLKDSL